MIELFPDQEESIRLLRESLKVNRHVLLQGATGSGKSVMSASMISKISDANKRTLFIVPRRELLWQMHLTFNKFNIDHSFIASKYSYDPDAKTHIASVDTLVRYYDKALTPDFVYFDEVHYGGTKNDQVINYFKEKGSRIIGMTATPWRSNGQGMGIWFDDMVLGKSIGWLIKNKRLSDYRAFSPSKPDLSQVRVSGGEYHKGDIASYMEEDTVLIGDAVEHYKLHAFGKICVGYCSSKKSAEKAAEKFREAGIPAMHIDSSTPDKERKRIIRDFALRKILVLFSVDLLVFGFDLSSQVNMDVTIEGMIDLQPRLSIAQQMQKWGRFLRYKIDPGILLDHANNIREHGLPDDDRKWVLESRIGAKKDPSEKTMPTRTCLECFLTHRPAPSCPECGYVYSVKPREIAEIEGRLVEFDKEEIRKQRAEEELKKQEAKEEHRKQKIEEENKKAIERRLRVSEEWQCSTMEDWLKLAKKRGHAKGWAFMRHKTQKRR